MIGRGRSTPVLRSEQKDILRQSVEANNSLEHIFHVISRLENELLEPQEFAQAKAALDARLKLLNKYLPDMKSIDPGGQVVLPAPVVIDADSYESMRRRMLDVDDC